MRTLRRLVVPDTARDAASSRLDQWAIDRTHRLYYGAKAHTWGNTTWLGVRAAKIPLDLWVYQEMVHEVRPDVIVECGTAWGGSALFLAGVCDLLGHGRVVTIDISEREGRPEHPRITYLAGSSTAPEVVETVRQLLGDGDVVMVLLDSDHGRDHVLAELRAYSPFVTPGSYIVVEDTNLGGHPVHPAHYPGPREAVEDFLRESDAFEVDRTREKFLLTFNPGGFLKRVR